MDPLVQRVLGDPSKYPRELTSWLAKTISGNRLFQMDWTQLPGPRISSGLTAPKVPEKGDIWFDLTLTKLKRYDGTVWVIF